MANRCEHPTSSAPRKGLSQRAPALGIVLAAALLSLAGCTDPVGIGDRAPDFRLKDTDGQEVGPGLIRGSVLMLHVFELDEPEQAEETLAKLVRIHANVSSGAVVFLSVAIADTDRPGTLDERNAETVRYKDSSDANWSFAAEDPPGRVKALYDVQRTTAGFMIDHDGIVRGYTGERFHPSCVEDTINLLLEHRLPNESIS